MTLSEMSAALGLRSLTPEIRAQEAAELGGGYVSDLLSDVLAHAPRQGVLVTIQSHLNVVAVAVHVGLAAVIFASARTPDEAVRKRAVDEGIVLYVSEETAFDVVGRLYSLGLRGHHA